MTIRPHERMSFTEQISTNFQLAENLDGQLKRMADDLKEVIDHLNTGTNTVDSSDPVLQIGKVLNAHMDR